MRPIYIGPDLSHNHKCKSHAFLQKLSFYKKELAFDGVTDALFMFVERYSNAVQIGLMAVI